MTATKPTFNKFPTHNSCSVKEAVDDGNKAYF